MILSSHIEKSIQSGVAFFMTVLILSVGYAALSGGLSTADKVGSGSGLTSASWNRIVDGVLELDRRTTTISSSWGNTGMGVANPSEALEVNGRIKSQNTHAIASSVSSISTISTSYTDMPGLTLTTTTGNQPIMILVNIGGCYSNTASALGYYTLQIDGVTVAATYHQYISSTWVQNAVINWMTTPVSGSHTFKVQWATNAGTLVCSWNGSTRSLMIWE